MISWGAHNTINIKDSGEEVTPMLSSHDLKPTPRVLRAFTSLDPAEFEMLLMPFDKAWKDYVHRYDIPKKARKRRYGGGRKPHLSTIDEKLLFILFYCTVYPLQEGIARLFGRSQGRANEWIDQLTPLLETALGEAQCFPERDPPNLAQVLALCVSGDCMMDGTARPTQRPTDPIAHKDHYSGKKKGIRCKTTSLVRWKSVWCASSVRPIPDVSRTRVCVMKKSQGCPPRLVCSKTRGSKDTTQQVSTLINRSKHPKGKS